MQPIELNGSVFIRNQLKFAHFSIKVKVTIHIVFRESIDYYHTVKFLYYIQTIR